MGISERRTTPPHDSLSTTRFDLVVSPEEQSFPGIRFGVYPEPGDIVPGRWLSNTELIAETGLRTFKGDPHTPKSLEELLGSNTRYVAGENETVGDMAVRAVEKIPGDPTKVAVLVFVTSYPTGENELEKIKKAFGYSNVQAETHVHAACSGGAIGFGVAKEYIDEQSRIAQEREEAGEDVEPMGDIVIVTSEKYSPTLEEPMDKAIFTDGARVIRFNPADLEILAVNTHAFPPEYASLIAMPVDETKLVKPYIYLPAPYAPKFTMNGRGVHKAVINNIAKLIKDTLAGLHLNLSDVDVIAPHQPSKKTLDAMANSKDMEENGEKVVRAIKTGNASSGAMLGAIKQSFEDGKLIPGKLLVAAGFGAGLTACIVVAQTKYGKINEAFQADPNLASRDESSRKLNAEDIDYKGVRDGILATQEAHKQKGLEPQYRELLIEEIQRLRDLHKRGLIRLRSKEQLQTIAAVGVVNRLAKARKMRSGSYAMAEGEEIMLSSSPQKPRGERSRVTSKTATFDDILLELLQEPAEDRKSLRNADIAERAGQELGIYVSVRRVVRRITAMRDDGRLEGRKVVKPQQ